MGFTSQDDFINEITNNGKWWRTDFMKSTAGTFAAGRWYDLSVFGGYPIANTYAGTALTSTIPTETTGWGLYHGGNVSTDTKHLVNISALGTTATSVPGVLMLVDICLYYPTISLNSATAQTLTTTNPLTRYTDGVGLRPFLVTTMASGATAHNVALSYTNQAGTAGKALGATVACTASSILGHLTHSGTAANNFGPFLPLASGDTGIRSVQSVTISAASGSGVGALVLAKPLATIPITTLGVMGERDLMNQLPSLPKIVDGACLSWLYFAGAATAAASGISGAIECAWG